MPPRIARSSVVPAHTKKLRNNGRKRNLDAFAIAGHENPEKVKVKQHRLGETLGEAPRVKRRRVEQDDDEASDDDYPPGQARGRNATKRQLGDDESVEEGSDSEGNEWTLGALGEDDDDSDIDDDEAFGESDDEKFEGFTFRGGAGKKTRVSTKRTTRLANLDPDEQQDLDLDESGSAGSKSGEDGEDDFGDEAIDLAQALDESDDDVMGANEPTAQDMGEYSGSSDEDDWNHSDDEGDERLARMRDMAEEYGGAADGDANITLPSSSGGDMKLSAADLLAGLDGDWKKQAAAIARPKKRIAAMKQTAPLAKRQQDKLDREVATKKAKEQLDRWRDTIIQNRQAEHLTFPLVDPQSSRPTVGKEKFVTATQEAPQTDLEASIAKIMEESGLSTSRHDKGGEISDEESGLLQSEELGVNKLPVEELLKRRAELRRQRELLFREEIKAKRIKKIKSKAYRRVHRRERERQADADKALFGVDEDEREREDRKRAEARMGARHKDSTWAKSLKATNRTAWDENARDSVIDQARRQEELKRRIAGADVSDEFHSDSSDDEDFEHSDGEEGMLKKIDQLRDAPEVERKGLAAMKFMRNAEQRQKARNNEDLVQLRDEFGDPVADSDASDNEEQSLGRAIFGPRPKETNAKRPKAKRPELEEGSASEADDSNHAVPEQTHPKKQPKSILKQPAVGQTNAKGPLAMASGLDRRNPNQSADSEDAAASSEWLRAEPSSGKRRTQRSTLEDNLAIPALVATHDQRTETTKVSKDVSSATTASGADGWQTISYSNGDDVADQDSGPENDRQAMLTPAQQKAELFRRAFAGDNVSQAFSADKKAAEDEEDEQEVSNHLPGWGSWAGEGLSKRVKKQNERTRHNPLHKTKIPGTTKEKRRDKGREDVIISERKEVEGGGKGNVYKAKVLPHGFETKEQWERSLRVPLGPEWTTKETFQRNARPRVVVKPGTVIEAIERPLV